LTQVGLINSARAQCQEIVLSQELYEQIPEDSENSEEEDELQAAWEAQVEREQWFRRLPEGDEPWKVAARENPDRWKTVFRSEATEEIVDAVAALWPQRTATFHFYMELLWQSRVEDNKPVPAMEPVPRTQLRARRANAAVMEEMTQMVDAEERRRDQETDAAVARHRSRMN
jgi:hypothetical protein